MVAGVALMAVAVLVPSSAGAVVVAPGVAVEVDNTPYSSDQGECDESRDGWHIIMNGIKTTDGKPPTADDFGPVNLMFSDGSTAQALFTDASGSKVAHFLNDDVNQEGAFTVTAGAMTFPNGTRITSFNKLVISHPPCGTIVTTTTTVPDTTTSTVPDTTTTTVPDTTTTTVPDTTTTTVPDTTTTTSPVTTETTTTTVPDTTTTTVPDTTTTTVPDTTTTTVPDTTTTTVPDTTTTTSPVTTETTTTTVPDTTTTTSPVSTETTTTTSPVSTETTTTTSPVSTLPTTTIPPGTPMSATIDTVYVERQVQAARTTRASTGSTLPSTGVDGGPFVVTGLLLLAAGISLWAINRRKATA
jgi:LPXTG-motif cell wall-anchored protein